MKHTAFSVAAANAAAVKKSAAPHFHDAAYEIRELTPDTGLVGKFMKLHHDVLLHLPAHGKHWVRRRMFASVHNHLKEGHVGIGVFAGKQMVGQALLTFPDLPGCRNLKGYPIGTGQMAAEDCMIVQTWGVSKNHQGHGIGRMMLQQVDAIARKYGRTHIVAKTDVANTGSVAGFEAAGYARSAETVVEGDPYKCVFMRKKVTPAAFAFMPVVQAPRAALTA